MMNDTTFPIPGPPGLPLIGNINDIDPNASIPDFERFANQYGEIYRLRFVNQHIIVTSKHYLVDDACDEKRFKKVPGNVLAEIRNGVHDGLFTAATEEPNWGVAHRVLMPAFGTLSIRNMFEEMHDIASQLVLKWARQGPSAKIPLTQDFTRLTLDSIALCSMGFRFNSYYADELHPFVKAMSNFLLESGRRIQRVPLTSSILHRGSEIQYNRDIAVMRETAEAVLRERITEGHKGRNDLLTAMLNGKDPKTGQRMSESSIIDNLITFLIAGHETTSGMLSYAVVSVLSMRFKPGCHSPLASKSQLFNPGPSLEY